MTIPNWKPPGRLIAVASGKGGVGKTFLSVQLTHAFARMGERALLFDGDLGLANVDVQLGLAPAADLGLVASGRVELADALTPVAGGADAGGFDVAAGRSGSGALAGLAGKEVDKLAASLAALALSYDRVVLDLGAGVETATLRLAASADDVLVVAQDEPTALTDAYAFIKRLRQRDEGAAPLIVVNAADNAAAARRAYQTLAKTCAQFLGFTPALLGTVRRDAKAKEAVRRQRLLADLPPRSAALDDIEALARALRGEAPAASPG